MSKPILRDPLEALLVAPRARQRDLPVADRRPADVEMTRPQDRTTSMVSDPFNGPIAIGDTGSPRRRRSP